MSELGRQLLVASVAEHSQARADFGVLLRSTWQNSDAKFRLCPPHSIKTPEGTELANPKISEGDGTGEVFGLEWSCTKEVSEFASWLAQNCLKQIPSKLGAVRPGGPVRPICKSFCVRSAKSGKVKKQSRLCFIEDHHRGPPINRTFRIGPEALGRFPCLVETSAEVEA
jgi:hypothetical protein